mmetsp:Transcript_39247/g.118039  ORF Transcript_39247/g.118039 Transcript_39247/m.118039 type:complete len:226 (-) Transcript_39247:889-1566(-)
MPTSEKSHHVNLIVIFIIGPQRIAQVVPPGSSHPSPSPSPPAAPPGPSRNVVAFLDDRRSGPRSRSAHWTGRDGLHGQFQGGHVRGVQVLLHRHAMRPSPAPASVPRDRGAGEGELQPPQFGQHRPRRNEVRVVPVPIFTIFVRVVLLFPPPPSLPRRMLPESEQCRDAAGTPGPVRRGWNRDVAQAQSARGARSIVPQPRIDAADVKLVGAGELTDPIAVPVGD